MLSLVRISSVRKTRITIAVLTLLASIGMGVWSATLRHEPKPATMRMERAAIPDGMVYVPGGNFLSGTNDEDADEDVRPQRRVFVPSFYIDRTEVTNREYQRFLPDQDFPPGEADLPVTNVTYDEADAYAKWVGKRLPTEAEWEKAARGTDGRRYPWGDDWNPARVAARAKATTLSSLRERQTKDPNTCLLGASRVRRVGSVPDGISPYGCLDTAGNAWEWVQGYYHGNPDQRILRGGAVGYGERASRTYTRSIEGSGAT